MNLDFNGLEKRDFIALTRLFTECDDERADAADAFQLGIVNAAPGAIAPIAATFAGLNENLLAALQSAAARCIGEAKAGQRPELVYLDGLVNFGEGAPVNLFDLSDFANLSLAEHLAGLLNVMFATALTVLEKLKAAPDAAAIVNEWVSVMNDVRAASNKEITRILADRPAGSQLN